MSQVKVIRVVQYEGTAEAVAEVIAKSMALGKHNKGDYTITIGEHLNELPEILNVSAEDVEAALGHNIRYEVRNVVMGTDWRTVSFGEYMQAVNLIEYQCRIIREPSA